MKLGVGMDVGTMNLVAARSSEEGTEFSRIRDAFLDVPLVSKKLLRLSGVDFIERDDELLILGDTAMETASVFGREARRPLKAGLVSPSEIDSIEVLGFLLQKVLGEPSEAGEYCYFSVPAEPVDQPEKDVIYHKRVFEKIISDMGYEAIPSNEAMAIIYACCAEDRFTGLSFSFGSGMTNVAMSLNAIECLSFSVARGGDWIDRGAAQSLGGTQAKMCSVKEKGMDLMDPQTREEEALSFYYKELISYSLDHVLIEFNKIRSQFNLNDPLPIVVSGGTSKAGSFLDFFKSVFERKRRKFPFEVSEIRAAEDPLNAVAQGLLVQARQEYI
ncbi:hypothetical protein CMI47_10585 [Candidatus Pacearchaeota archaeon]|nr:hypothetical protein [Candidatus Pacearchaeota archaeon]|tara:strand:- start:1370 stop:2359 length:990 start_codon:yes stop_codon:yes gene_type:complete